MSRNKLDAWIDKHHDLLFSKWSMQRAQVAIQFLENPYLEMDVMKPHRVAWMDFFPVLDKGDDAATIEFLETEWAVRTLKMSGEQEEEEC